MTEGVALELARAKMRELGIGKKYLLRYRHFQLQPSKKMVLIMGSDLLILLIPDVDTRIFSRNGIFDLKDLAVSEMQYLHSGDVNLENLNTKTAIQIKLLQVIPILKTH